MYLLCLKNICYTLAFRAIIKYLMFLLEQCTYVVIFLELTRILKSYYAVTTHAIGRGCFNTISLAFEERRTYYGVL